jgi:hypothetical protein
VAFLTSHNASPILASALIFAVLAGGLPLLSGVIIADTGGPPAFTLDICHPAPGVNHCAGLSAPPLRSTPRLIQRPPASGVVHEREAALMIRPGQPPDPPPPK